MKLILNDVSYDVQDEAVLSIVHDTLNLLVPRYKELPQMAKSILQMFVRGYADILLSELPKGADPVLYLADRYPTLIKELLLPDAKLTLISGRTDDPFTITSVKLQLQSESEGG